MNVEIGAEAAQFPEKEYINGIAVAVYMNIVLYMHIQSTIFAQVQIKQTFFKIVIIFIFHFPWSTCK